MNTSVFHKEESLNQFIFKNEKNGVELWLKREDLLHSEISGNKFRKLKYNLKEAEKEGFKKLLTFGGAFSNHIAATAAAGKACGFDTIGIIRGEELAKKLQETLQQNETLKFAHDCGMQLHFISREAFRKKHSSEMLLEFQKMFGNCYVLPEGGTNELAVKGCEEILTEDDAKFDVICTAVGTGGTISGLINASAENQQVLGFPALKENFLASEIEKFSEKKNWRLIRDYHFGGYAKINAELVTFINEFKKSFRIQLDPIYTGKMLFGIFDLIKTGFFPENTRILAIHTGGLQGIAGMNKFLKSKNLPEIT